MRDDYELQLGPLAIIALQRLSNKKFEPTELLPRIRSIQNASIVWQLESWPYVRSVAYVGARATYELKLPRKIPYGKSYLSASSAKLSVTPSSGYMEAELLQLITELTS